MRNQPVSPVIGRKASEVGKLPVYQPLCLMHFSECVGMCFQVVKRRFGGFGRVTWSEHRLFLVVAGGVLLL